MAQLRITSLPNSTISEVFDDAGLLGTIEILPAAPWFITQVDGNSDSRTFPHLSDALDYFQSIATLIEETR